MGQQGGVHQKVRVTSHGPPLSRPRCLNCLSFSTENQSWDFSGPVVRLCAPIAGSTGSIPGWGTKIIPSAVRQKKKKKKKKCQAGNKNSENCFLLFVHLMKKKLK